MTQQDPNFTRNKNFVVIALLVLGVLIAIWFATKAGERDNMFDVILPAGWF